MAKEIHIVFQVLNFLHSTHHLAIIACPNMHRLLINLASHNGPKGICPSVSTIAHELHLGDSTIRRLIQKWKEVEIVKIVENLGKPNGYLLYIPNTTPLTTEIPQVIHTPLTTERGPLSLLSKTPLTTERIYNKGTTKPIKSFYMQKAENEKRHNFAQSMDQMASEKRHIEEHEKKKAIELQMKRTNSISPILEDFLNKQEKH